ncbi:hypothetical protein U4I41_10140 [Stenotrophomonas maltophilia]|uniref:hypothetical protein n=1 Tax=Stenotrophomonas maltophilia TaxID=40324 RepID=UPI002A9F815F|nr:hypothetical protein [Stenotrophomonas maltophilia]MDZ5832709.1 hypothetical protein [Stenotrophomonas maltophilia]HEL4164359.1 hypothetical protein [Stenotrophomonas maltophilia]
MHLNDVKVCTIPGFPTFFWQLPGNELLATLRIDSPVTAQGPFQAYCEQFLTTQSTQAVQLPPDPADPDAITVFGYRKVKTDEPSSQFHPRFRTALYSKPGINDIVVKRYDDIRKVHRRTTIEFKTVEQRSVWQKGLGLMGMGAPKQAPRTAKVNSSLSMRLTKKEVQELVDNWGQRAQDLDWDDYGFQFKGESRVNWLSGATARGEVRLDGIRSQDGSINTKMLLEKLMRRRTALLKELLE